MPEYIEREAVISIIEEKQKDLCPLGHFSRHDLYGTDRETFDNWQEIADWVDGIPAADVEPVRHGRWVKPIPGDGENYCSVCKAPQPWFYDGGYQEYDFCPYCGAKMDMKS